MNNKIIMVSTFRHLFLGLSLACSDKVSRYHVLFIDQKTEEENNRFYQIAKEVLKPFATVSAIPVRLKVQSKKKYRNVVFRLLDAMLETLKPVELITGNDRRLEFQYAMYFLTNKLSLKTQGGYLDDGTGSYRNMHDFKHLSRLSDQLIDTPLKRLAYGRWYHRPKTLGASKWIDCSYLTFPDIALSPLKSKKILKIEGPQYTKGFLASIIKEYANYFCIESCSGVSKSVLIALPHSSIIKELYGSKYNLMSKVEEMLRLYPSAFVKYHPREVGDPLGLKERATFLSASVPAEFYLATINFDLVIGDVSTVLMSAKWLQPGCDVQYLPNNSGHTKALKSIFQDLNINEFVL